MSKESGIGKQEFPQVNEAGNRLEEVKERIRSLAAEKTRLTQGAITRQYLKTERERKIWDKAHSLDNTEERIKEIDRELASLREEKEFLRSTTAKPGGRDKDSD